MVECYRCGVSGEITKLYDAISNKGIIKICADCAAVEHIPIIKKPTENQLTESQRHKTVQERLASMNRTRPIGKEITLRALVDRDLKAKKLQAPSDLAENFHWIIQRIRRARKIQREEFAKGIGESEATVRMIEQGFLPESNYQVITKIENFLKVSLRKSGASSFPNADSMSKYSFDNSMVKESEKKLAFDENSSRKLKIADLKDMKKRQEQQNRKTESKENVEWESEYSQDDEKFLDKNYNSESDEADFPEEED